MSFSRAAASYDSYAKLQQQVGEQLLATVPSGTRQQVRQAVDMGCGTGYFIPRLVESFQPEHLTGVDLAPGMLSYAREHHAGDNISWVCGDAEALPLAADSVDLIFSSLAIQWCENLPGCLPRCIGYCVRAGSLFSVRSGRKVFVSCGHPGPRLITISTSVSLRRCVSCAAVSEAFRKSALM